jgi:hypothetical protein
LLLVFRAVKPMMQNFSLAVRLVDATGKLLWEEQNWPADAPTSTWNVARRLWYDHHTIVIPSAAAPGLYRLECYFTDPASQAKLVARNIVDGVVVGEIAPLAYVQVGPTPPPPPFPLAPPPHLGGQIELVGSTQPTQTVLAPGVLLPVELTWQALARPQLDYTGSVQLLDAQGRLVAQDDHPLTENFIPSTLWNPGLRIPDRYAIQLPGTAVPGAYRLIVGVYDLTTGARLPVTLNGQPAGDAVTIGEILLAPSR